MNVGRIPRAAIFISLALTVPFTTVCAQKDHSTERSVGIGVSYPNTLNLRLWMQDVVGMEATARVSLTSGKSDLEAAVIILLKLLNRRMLDLYSTTGLQVFSTEATEFTTLTVAPAGGLGVELSPIRPLALSIEAKARMVLSPVVLSGGLNAAIHVYF